MAGKKVLCIVLIFSIAACNNRSRDESISNEPVFTKSDSSSIFSDSVTSWLNKNLKTDPEKRTIALEERWEMDSVQVEPFLPDTLFYKTYSSLLYWSSDSSYLLDVGSYGMVPVKDGKGNITLEAGEPDTEIALIDVKKSQRIRLMYVGPSSTIMSGRWLNNTDALVLGTFMDNDRKTDTLLWFINVKDNLFRLYNIRSGK